MEDLNDILKNLVELNYGCKRRKGILKSFARSWKVFENGSPNLEQYFLDAIKKLCKSKNQDFLGYTKNYLKKKSLLEFDFSLYPIK